MQRLLYLAHVGLGQVKGAAAGAGKAGWCRRRRAIEGGVVTQLKVGVAGVGSGHRPGVGAHAVGKQAGQLDAVRHQPRLMAGAQRRKLGGAGAEDADGQHQRRHQHLDERKPAGRTRTHTHTHTRTPMQAHMQTQPQTHHDTSARPTPIDARGDRQGLLSSLLAAY